MFPFLLLIILAYESNSNGGIPSLHPLCNHIKVYSFVKVIHCLKRSKYGIPSAYEDTCILMNIFVWVFIYIPTDTTHTNTHIHIYIYYDVSCKKQLCSQKKSSMDDDAEIRHDFRAKIEWPLTLSTQLYFKIPPIGIDGEKELRESMLSL